ncbi:MAG: GNAT family N-acetyltransferase [Candidatus Nanohaloarchaea archaeon]
MTEVRKLEGHEEMEKAVETMESCFSGIPDRELIPDHVFTALSRHGVLLGAFREEMVGFAAGFRSGDSLYLHAMGVLPGARGESVGKDLLREVCRTARDRGLESVALTYDPLMPANARLYIHCAGGEAVEFTRDLYGEQQNDTNAGDTPTDRLHVRIRLDRPDVERFMAGEEAGKQEKPPETIEDGGEIREDLPAEVGFPLPGSLSELEDREEVRAREKTREVLGELVERGYVVTGFATEKDGYERSTYVLEEKR